MVQEKSQIFFLRDGRAVLDFIIAHYIFGYEKHCFASITLTLHVRVIWTTRTFRHNPSDVL